MWSLAAFTITFVPLPFSSLFSVMVLIKVRYLWLSHNLAFTTLSTPSGWEWACLTLACLASLFGLSNAISIGRTLVTRKSQDKGTSSTGTTSGSSKLRWFPRFGITSKTSRLSRAVAATELARAEKEERERERRKKEAGRAYGVG